MSLKKTRGKRAVAAGVRFWKRKSGKPRRVLLVSHGGVCRIICNYFRNLENEEFVSCAFANCGLEKYEL